MRKTRQWKNVEAMVRAGLTITDACRRVGVTREGYWYWRRARAAGLPARHRGPAVAVKLGPHGGAWWAALLRDTRRKRRLTRAALARRAGYADSSLADWERGLRVPTIAALETVLAALGHRIAVEPRDG